MSIHTSGCGRMGKSDWPWSVLTIMESRYQEKKKLRPERVDTLDVLDVLDAPGLNWMQLARVSCVQMQLPQHMRSEQGVPLHMLTVRGVSSYFPSVCSRVFGT
jgi:hypothetical protein